MEASKVTILSGTQAALEKPLSRLQKRQLREDKINLDVDESELIDLRDHQLSEIYNEELES